MVKPGDIDVSIKRGDVDAVIARGEAFIKRWLSDNDPDWQDAAILALTMACNMALRRWGRSIKTDAVYIRVLGIIKPLLPIEAARKAG